jgi:hypothetical protein
MEVADEAQALEIVLLGPFRPNSMDTWAAMALFIASTTVMGRRRATFCSSKAV